MNNRPNFIAERWLVLTDYRARHYVPERPEDFFGYGRDDAWPRGYKSLEGLNRNNPGATAVRVKLVDAEWLDGMLEHLDQLERALG